MIKKKSLFSGLHKFTLTELTVMCVFFFLQLHNAFLIYSISHQQMFKYAREISKNTGEDLHRPLERVLHKVSTCMWSSLF